MKFVILSLMVIFISGVAGVARAADSKLDLKPRASKSNSKELDTKNLQEPKKAEPAVVATLTCRDKSGRELKDGEAGFEDCRSNAREIFSPINHGVPVPGESGVNVQINK